jgi:small subunit ribosomal protein S8
MNVTDPIADLLTRIRNAQVVKHSTVRTPGSKVLLAVSKVLEAEGYVSAVRWVEEGHQGVVEVDLKYGTDGKAAIRGLKRVSKPGQRQYVKKDEIPQVLNGLGIAILSTSQGVMTGKQAAERSTGGELLAKIW